MAQRATRDELTISEAARRLGVSRQRVHQLITAGKLEARKVIQPQGTALWLIQRAAVERHARRRNRRPRLAAMQGIDPAVIRRAEQLNRELPVTPVGSPYPRRPRPDPKSVLRVLDRVHRDIAKHHINLPTDLSEHLRDYLYGERGRGESE